MKRLGIWDQHLAACIEERRRMPFAWGVNDCCQFAREALRVQTGEDPAGSWQLPEYSTARGAKLVLDAVGGVAALPERAGLKTIPLAMAQRGDLVLVPVGRRVALGVCLGQMTAAPGKRGLEFIPTLDCERAWRI